MNTYVIFPLLVMIIMESVYGFLPRAFERGPPRGPPGSHLRGLPGGPARGPPGFDRMKPFGCLKLKPNMTNTMQCLKQIQEDFMPEEESAGEITLPSFKIVVEKFTKCKYKNTVLIDEEGLSTKNYLTFLRENEINFSRSNQEDIVILTTFIDICISEMDFNDESEFTATLSLENCINRKIIKKCMNDGDGEKPENLGGLILPMKIFLNSLAIPNDNCDSVEISEEAQKKYTTCIENEEYKQNNGDIAEQLFNSGDIPNHQAILSLIKQIPEIKCRSYIGKYYNYITANDMMDITALAEWIGNMNGWDNANNKKKVQKSITECGKMADDDGDGMISLADGKQHMKMMMCIIPRYINVCGLDNELTKEVMLPVLDEKLISKIANVLRSSVEDMSAFKKMVMDRFFQMG